MSDKLFALENIQILPGSPVFLLQTGRKSNILTERKDFDLEKCGQKFTCEKVNMKCLVGSADRFTFIIKVLYQARAFEP